MHNCFLPFCLSFCLSHSLSSFETKPFVSGKMSDKDGASRAAAVSRKFKEAPPGSDWFKAIEAGRSGRVMRLLEGDPSRLQQTDDEGRTALHVLVLDSRADLVKKVLRICHGQWRASSSSSSHQEDAAAFTVQDLVEAVDRSCNETAFGYALLVGNKEIAETLVRAYQGKEDVEIREDDARQRDERDATQREQLRSIIKQLPRILQHKFPDSEDHIRMLDDVLKEVREGNEGVECAFHHLCYSFFIDPSYSFFIGPSYTIFVDPFETRNKKCDCVSEIMDAIGEEVKNVGPSLVRFLFKLQDRRGNAPLHAAFRGVLHRPMGTNRLVLLFGLNMLKKLLQLIPEGEGEAECVNAVDNAGRTLLHLAAAGSNHDFVHYFVGEILVDDKRTDLNAKFTPFVKHMGVDKAVWKALMPNTKVDDADAVFGDLTALHLAVLNDNVSFVRSLHDLERKNLSIDMNSGASGRAALGSGKGNSYVLWTPLQIAAVLGNTEILKLLLEDDRAYDLGRIKNISIMPIPYTLDPALHLAAYVDNAEAVKLILDNQAFDPMVKYVGCCALHRAVGESIERHFQCIAYCAKFYIWRKQIHERRTFVQENSIITRYSGKKGCINFLLQASLNVWNEDGGEHPSPDLSASEEDITWWYEKVDNVTKDAKNSLTAATNAIAVTAALVATASFVGPLQPPLGYQNDTTYIDYELLPVRIFIVCNSLSFYLAIAAIVLSVIPSLPLPQEPIWIELQRIRRTVIVAVCLLLGSIIFVLVSFSAASIAVLPDEWSHRALAFGTSMVGGIICLAILSLISLRLARLVLHKNPNVRHLYHRFVKF